MTSDIHIRESLPTDREALEELYPAAFPDEDLLPLIRELLDEKENVFSLVAVRDEAIIGNIVFTICGVTGRSEKVSLLAPLAVRPDSQKQGVGRALIQEGLNQQKNEGATEVFVLGDPAYYGRFGFAQEDNVKPPYDLPQEWRSAWQSISLGNAGPDFDGVLTVPKPWRHPNLWA